MAVLTGRRRFVIGGIASGVMSSLGCAALPQTTRASDGGAARTRREILAELAYLDRQAHLRTGGAGDLGLAIRLEQRLSALGFAIERQHVEIDGFDVANCHVRWRDGEALLEPQFPVAPTGPAGVSGRLALWRHGDDTATLRDAIAVLALAPRRHSRLLSNEILRPLSEALKGGPQAIIIVTDGPTGETLYLNAPDKSPAGATPLAVIGPAPGALLLDAARRGSPSQLVIDGQATRLKSWNIIARRRGTGPMLVVSTPRTAWTPAVAERGPGLAAFLHLAEWARRSAGNRELLFLNTTAHEFDNLGGRHFFSSAAAPPPPSVALWAHLGAGFAARAHHELSDYRNLPLDAVEPQRFLLGSQALLPTLRTAFTGQPGLSTPYPISAGAAGELEEIAAHGYEPLFGLFGAHLRHHAMSDRLPMTEPVWVYDAIAAARSAIAAILR